MTEHCGTKAGMSGAMGYVLGGFFGLFMSGVETSNAPSKGIKHEWKMMKGNMHRTGKNFGGIGNVSVSMNSKS